jgi:lipoprotein-anchoring transpeptidase ErfK/SrfK
VPAEASGVWIKVSIEAQRVYIMNGNHPLITMVASTGLGDERTPMGVYSIQKERGYFFYNSKLHEGAFYWVSWLNHGEYLFHSVATDEHGKVDAEEAKKLGHAASHGCTRLSMKDAKWIYDNIPYGTKVFIGP